MSSEVGLQRNEYMPRVISRFLDANKAVAERIASPRHKQLLAEFLAECPDTDFAFSCCIDERTNGPEWCRAPYATCKLWKSPGGNLTLGSKLFANELEICSQRSLVQGKKFLVIATYHLSAAHQDKGCKAVHYDRDRAYSNALSLKNQIDTVFQRNGVYAIVMGMETDTQTFILHDEKQTLCFELSSYRGKPFDDIKDLVASSYPSFPLSVVNDLARLLYRNLNRSTVVPCDRLAYHSDHRAYGIGVGRGFESVHENQIVTVGLWGYEIDKAIAIAGKVLLENLEHGRIPKEDGVALICQAGYYVAGVDRRNIRFAEIQAQHLLDFSLGVLEKQVPEVFRYVSAIAGTINMNTFEFQPLQ